MTRTIIKSAYKVVTTITTATAGTQTALRVDQTGYLMRAEAYSIAGAGAGATDITLVTDHGSTVMGPDLLDGNGLDAVLDTALDSADISPSKPKLFVQDDLIIDIDGATGGDGEFIVVVLYIDPNVEIN